MKDKGFGDRLSEMMRLRGVSNAALAKAAGVHIKRISQWRGGERPNEPSLQLIAKTLGVAPEWLRYGAPDSEPVVIVQPDPVRALAIRQARALLHLLETGHPVEETFTAEEGLAKLDEAEREAEPPKKKPDGHKRHA